MAEFETSKLIRHVWSDLFDLVLDVPRYPEFVPHCRAVRLLSRKTHEPDLTVIVSRMTVGFAALEVSYANRTTADPTSRRISVDALDGPLRHLHALWRFEPRDDNRTELHFAVDYAFSNPLLAALASRLFAAMFGEIVNAFERRADRLYGDKAAPRHRREGEEPPPAAGQRRLTTS